MVSATYLLPTLSNHVIFIAFFICVNFESMFSINALLIKAIDKNIVSYSTTATKMVTKIMEVCYRDDLDNVVLVDDWGDFQAWRHYFPTEMSYKMYGISQRKVYRQYQRTSGVYKLHDAIVRKLYYPAKIFVISMRDHDFLREILKLLKKSIIWNSRAVFIVIEKSCCNSCSNITPTIEVLWEFNILHAVYLCRDSEENMNFYNFNPYTSYGVEPWKLVDKLVDETRNHSTSVFHFAISIEDFKAPICESLNFDKTKKLDNYPIKMSGAVGPALFRNISVLKNPGFLNSFEGMDKVVNEIIWTKLGVTPTITIYDNGYIGSDHVPHGSIKEVVDGKYDMGVNQYFSRNFWRLQTYPHAMSGIYAVSSLEEKPNYNSRLMISEPVIFVVIGLVSLFTILGLKYFLKMNFIQTFEANFKLLLGIPIRHAHSGGKKLFLFYVTFVAFIISIFLQSSLSSSLVLPSNVFLIDDRDDLLAAISSKYKLFGPHFITEFLSENITKAFEPEKFSACAEKLRTRTKAVCLSDGFSINVCAKNVDDVHISEHKIRTWDYVFIVREDWPLRSRVNFLIGQLKESGILRKFFKNGLTAVQAHHDKHKDMKEHAPFRHLSLRSLDFSMIILFVGLFTAFWVFIAERMKMRRYQQGGRNRHKLNNLNIFKQSRP